MGHLGRPLCDQHPMLGVSSLTANRSASKSISASIRQHQHTTKQKGLRDCTHPSPITRLLFFCNPYSQEGHGEATDDSQSVNIQRALLRMPSVFTDDNIEADSSPSAGVDVHSILHSTVHWKPVQDQPVPFNCSEGQIAQGPASSAPCPNALPVSSVSGSSHIDAGSDIQRRLYLRPIQQFLSLLIRR